MDRQIVYPAQILPETSLLQMAKDSMIGLAKLSSALLGVSTMASGFAVTPTGPASLQVLCAPGEIYSLTAIDSLAFSTLPADTTHTILKQGILLDGLTLNCPAPGTTGQSINYLVQAAYQDLDSTPVLLPYYNSANPALPFSGQGNNGLTQNTVRKGAAIVAVKAGASATTGSQTTPAPDAGYIGLYVVTVAFGQTTITAGSIAVAPAAPLINASLHGLTPTFSVPVAVAPATQSQHAVQLSQAQSLGAPIQSITASVAANALTVGWNATALNFRSPTLTTGTPVTANPAAALSLVVPSGATLGTISAQQATLMLLVAYNGGSPVLCVANLAGGIDLSETNLISPTTISSGATSASTIYSASAVSANSPYRVVGSINITEATAGVWATDRSFIQGAGGQAFAALQSFGFGQIWQDVTASRSYGATYYNTTPRPRLISTSGNPTSVNTGFRCYVNSTQVCAVSSASGQTACANFIVPPVASYRIDNGSAITSPIWSELG